MEKTTLKKIIKAVRDLEVKESKNDSQFEFYQKKKRRIEYKERRMLTELSNYWDEISDYNEERKKLTINQDNYKYMYMKQD
nr:MAG TPA: hypothetical protein [Caudoviricetes sp.]